MPKSGFPRKEIIRMSTREIYVNVLRESFINNKDLYQVVAEYELLTAAAKTSLDDPEIRNALAATAYNLQSLLQTTLKLTTKNLLLCQTEANVVWVMEVDYRFEDNPNDPMVGTCLPSIKELAAEGLETIVGEEVGIASVSDLLTTDLSVDDFDETYDGAELIDVEDEGELVDE